MTVTRRSWRRQTVASPWLLTNPPAINRDMGFTMPAGSTSATLLRTRASAQFSVLAVPTGGTPEDGWEAVVNASGVFFTYGSTTPPVPTVVDPWFGTFGGVDLLALATLNQGSKAIGATGGGESCSWQLPGDMIDSKAQRVLTPSTRIMGGISCFSPGLLIGEDDGNAAYYWKYRLNVAFLVQYVSPT